MAGYGELEGLSVIVPTYKERANAAALLSRIAAVRPDLPENLEILIIDDNSPDGTAETFRTLGDRMGLPVRVVLRLGPRGLGLAILEGLAQSRGDLVCVMDADLSHPPEEIPKMLRVLDGADGVVASRYAEKGRIVSWPRHRRLISWGATALARTLIRCECSDPVSGFFLFRRSSLEGLPLTGLGNKPLFEILAAKPLTIHEVPYEFRDRVEGRSKLGGRGIAAFAHLLLLLGARSISGTLGRPAYEAGAADQTREP